MSSVAHASTLWVMSIVPQTPTMRYDVTRGRSSIEISVNASAESSAAEATPVQMQPTEEVRDTAETLTAQRVVIPKRDSADVVVENHRTELLSDTGEVPAATAKRTMNDEHPSASTPHCVQRQPTRHMLTAAIASVALPQMNAAEASGSRWDEPPSSFPSNPAPQYPAAALAAGQAGTVLLTVRIAADGTVTSAELFRSSGVDLLDTAALETVARWKFQPAKRRGRGIDVTVRVPIRFRLK